jgi:hypothetical protein
MTCSPDPAEIIVRVKPPKQLPVPGAVTVNVGPNELTAAYAAANAGDTLIVTGEQDLEDGPDGGKQIDFRKRIIIQNAIGQRAKINGRVVWHPDAADSEMTGGTDPREGIIIDATLGPEGPSSVTIGAANVVLNGYELYNGHRNIGINTIGIDDDTWGHGIDADLSYGLIHDIGPMPPENHAHGLYLSAQQTYADHLEIYDCADRAVQFRSGSGCHLAHVYFHDCGEGVIYANDTDPSGELGESAWGVDNWLARSIGRNNQVTTRSLIEEYTLQSIPRCGVEGFFLNDDGRDPIDGWVMNVDVAGVKNVDPAVPVKGVYSDYGPWWLYEVPISGVALASYRCRVAWNTYQLGLVTFGYSRFDYADVFASSPWTATFLGAYDDLSDMLRDAEVEIGRDSYLTTVLGSTARISLRDPTGILNAENADGPLYDSGELTERLHPVRLEGVFAAATFPLYSGWVREINWEPSGRKGYAYLDCVDLTWWLGERCYPIIAATGETTTGAAIGLILDALGWTDSTLRDLDVGDTIPDFSADGSKSGLQLIEELLETERGTFYIAADGTATYRDRSWRQTLDSVAVIEDEMSFVAPGVDFDMAITRARVERLQSGYIAEAVAPANDQRKFGWNDLPPIATPYLLADAGADSLADWLIWVLSRPRPPMHDVAIDNRTAYQLYQMLARSFGERITLISAQTGLGEDFHIEKLRHTIGGRPRHTCSMLVSRVIPKAGQFAVSEFDGADVFVY